MQMEIAANILMLQRKNESWDEKNTKRKWPVFICIFTCDPENPPIGYSNTGDDCGSDSKNTYFHPNTQEYCNDLDEDCDGNNRNDYSVNAREYYLDADGDGYGGVDSGNSDEGYMAMCDSPEGYAINQLDWAIPTNRFSQCSRKFIDGIKHLTVMRESDGEDAVNRDTRTISIG